MMRWDTRTQAVLAVFLLLIVVTGCSRRQPPVARPAPAPPPGAVTSPTRPPAPPEPVAEPMLVPPEPITEADAMASRSLDELNRNSPFQPVFFAYDSSDIDADGRAVLSANAELLKRYPSWVVTIEGHCDERGTAEYNLALGERRALAARSYMMSLGIAPDRLRTISYGKEFPFDPGSNEEAWAKNRRAHFVVTTM